MKINYEKHQRDYTLLASLEIIDEFFNERMRKLFSYHSQPVHILFEDGIFYHFIAIKDYLGWPSAYVRKHSTEDLQKYEEKLHKELENYRKFLKSKHSNILDDILKLHEYMRLFMPIIVLTAYLPMHYKGKNKKIIALCLKLRNKYEDTHKVGISLQKKLLNNLEKKLAIEHDSLQYLTSGEFRNFLSLQKLPKKLKERKKFFLIEISHKGEKIFNKNEALSKINEIDINRKVGNVSEIKGQIAFRGIARGRVRVIRLVAEAKKIKEGDVLVASMTDPRYVPIMKKAAAIVTDEGGITCHAAIVARELKKPCIIGTKIATKVLKDGDLVEVDAEKGIVRILK